MEEGAGAALARTYSAEVVEPLLQRALPGLPFSTARLGSGSDVLGLDDRTSQDHDWGLRLTVVVPEGQQRSVDAVLDRDLPERFRGLPTRFPTTWDPVVRQRAEVTTLDDLCRARTGVSAAGPRTLLDRLSLTGQAVLEVTAGPVLRDDDSVLGALPVRFAMDEGVRRWAIAAAWEKAAEELPFVGRTADRGDEAGSRIIAARLAQTLMRLGFLLEGRWSPYSKWLGTAFTRLPAAGRAEPALDGAVAAPTWHDREAGLVAALDLLAELQAGQGLPARLPATEAFWDRPYRAVNGIGPLVLATVRDPVLRRLRPVGLPDQWTDDVRLLVDHDLRRAAVAGLLTTATAG